MTTRESAALRESIRQGHISPDLDREEWEYAVARIYELERGAEAQGERAEGTPAPTAPSVAAA